jgi:hypothetical protein
MWLTCLYLFNFFNQMCFIIWVILIVFCEIDYCLTPLVFTFKSPKSKFKLKVSSNGFLVWIPWHSYEWKNNTCHDCHGFKWWNINIYPILIGFFAIWCLFWHVGLWLHPLGTILSQEKIFSFFTPTLVTFIWFNYISITFGHFKFASGLLH